MKLKGKVALITGARGGIGRAIAARFIVEGAVVFSADLNESGSGGGDAGGQFLQMDVSSESDVMAAMTAIKTAHGRLDILVNAAGIEIEKNHRRHDFGRMESLLCRQCYGDFFNL